MMKGQLQIVVMYLSKTTQPPQYLLQPEENPHILKNEKLDTLNVIFHFIFRVPEPAQLDLKESTFTMTPQCLNCPKQLQHTRTRGLRTSGQ